MERNTRERGREGRAGRVLLRIGRPIKSVSSRKYVRRWMIGRRGGGECELPVEGRDKQKKKHTRARGARTEADREKTRKYGVWEPRGTAKDGDAHTGTSGNAVGIRGRERGYWGREKRRKGRRQAKARRSIEIIASEDHLGLCSRAISHQETG